MGILQERAGRGVPRRAGKHTRPPDDPGGVQREHSTGHACPHTVRGQPQCELMQQERLATLVGGVAHDFNNLLVGILGNASLALESLPDNASERALLDRIVDAARRATSLTAQMNAYAGEVDSVCEPLDLRELLERVGNAAQLLRENVRINWDLADGLPPVDGSWPQLQSVIRHVLQNAVEALGEQGGEVTIRSGMVAATVSATPESPTNADTFVFAEVRDSGCGMDEDTRRRMFEPFFTTKFTGRGLGLAGAQGIVREHGGRIHVRSRPGCGTTVRIMLPVTEPAERPLLGARHGRQRSRLPHGGAPRVLVVDDDPDVLEVSSLCLRRAGFEVRAVLDGDEAVETYRREDIDVVLLDLVMPGEDGYCVLCRVRELDQSARVILTSGLSGTSVKRRMRKEKPTAFLPKPFTAEALVSAVRTCIAV
jgi:CheY-like chemotaxis protein